MSAQQFDELLEWQAEIADAIVALQEQLLRYEKLEKNLLQRREKALMNHYLDLKNDLKEIEYALHYVQEQQELKNTELYHLQEDFQHKIDSVINHYRNLSTERV